MSTKNPKVAAWLAMVPSIIMLLLFVLFWATAFPFIGPGMGLVTYFFMGMLIRKILLKHQNQGLKLVRNESYPEAIEAFQSSYDFFQENSWLDKFRNFVFLFPFPVPLREVALLNIAHCYGQLRMGKEAKAYYERVLVEFPNSTLAPKGLRTLEAGKEI